jgi:hypothetical protein
MSIQNIDAKRAVDITPGERTKLAVFTFKMMRRWVGILGLLIGVVLPVITAIFTDCWKIQESISHYYYTVGGDVFVGLLCAVAFFLILYPGDGEWQDFWTNLAGVLALAVAFFPTTYDQLDQSCTKRSFAYADWVSTVHLSCAAVFFIILGGVSIFQFPRKLEAGEDTTKRWVRNFCYRLCGIVMWLCILLLAPMVISDPYDYYLSVNKYVFWLEVVALVAFGLSWLVKGWELERGYEVQMK